MTDGQKMEITKLRQDGFGYTAIAKQMGLSRDTVQSFCRRNGLAGEIIIKIEKVEEQSQKDFCRECGKKLQQTDGIKKRIFEKEFTAYGNSHRKYCSHECYVKSRFKGGDGNE